jgi:UPF0716 protein FxsA
VGQAIGVLPTLALLIADALLGSILLRHQGRAAWVRFNRALAENRIPHKEVFDGVLIIFGGALLLTPGFITDIFGLILLIPPTRDLVRRALTAFAKRRSAARVAFWGFGQYDRRRAERSSANGRAAGPFGPGTWPTQGDREPGAARPYDVEGSGHEVVDEPSRQLPHEHENER